MSNDMVGEMSEILVWSVYLTRGVEIRVDQQSDLQEQRE